MIKLPKPTLYLRIDKRKKDGRMPLYIRFPRIDGEEPKFPTGIDLLPEEWDDTAKCPYDEALKLIVEKELSRIRTRIYNALVNGEELTKSLLREIVTNREPESPGNASFYGYFDKYVLERMQTGRISRATEKGYDTTRRALKYGQTNEKYKEDSRKSSTAYRKPITYSRASNFGSKKRAFSELDGQLGGQLDGQIKPIQPPIIPYFNQKTGIFQRFDPL